MRITPLDVRKQEFKKVVRGLDPEEVYAFLATVADEYETVLTDNRQLRDRVLELDEKVTEYRNMEKTLRDTLMTAERVMAEARENARKEADLLLRDAKVQAQQDSQNTAAQAEALKAQLRELRSQRDGFLARLRGMAEAQIGMVASFVKDFEEDDRHQDWSPSNSYQETARYTSPAEPVIDNHQPTQPPAPTSPEPDWPEVARHDQGYSAESEPQAFAPQELPSAPSYPESQTTYPASQPTYPESQRLVDSDGPTRGYSPPESVDQWRAYAPGETDAESLPASADTESVQAPSSEPVESFQPAVVEPELAAPAPIYTPVEPTVGELASTVAEMVEAAGAQSGHLDQSMPSSPGSGGEGSYLPPTEQPEEEPAAVASAEESEESQEGSRWSISRFTRGLGDF